MKAARCSVRSVGRRFAEAPLRLLEAAETGVLVVDRPLNAALAAESDAEQDVAPSRRAVATFRAAIPEAERALAGAQWRVNEACKPVLAAEAAPLLVEAESLKAEFDKMRAALSFLSSSLPAGSTLRLLIDNALACAPARNLEPPANGAKPTPCSCATPPPHCPKDLLDRRRDTQRGGFRAALCCFESRNQDTARWLVSTTIRSVEDLMKKPIIFAIVAACLAAPALAGTNDANQTTDSPGTQQNARSVPEDAQPGSIADRRDDAKKGLSRDPEDCNKGCIGGNP
jgi:hypothetical protein